MVDMLALGYFKEWQGQGEQERIALIERMKELVGSEITMPGWSKRIAWPSTWDSLACERALTMIGA